MQDRSNDFRIIINIDNGSSRHCRSMRTIELFELLNISNKQQQHFTSNRLSFIPVIFFCSSQFSQGTLFIVNSLFSVFGFVICFSFTLHLFTIPFCLGLVLSLFWIFSSIAFFVWCVHVDICLFVVLFLWIFLFLIH